MWDSLNPGRVEKESKLEKKNYFSAVVDLISTEVTNQVGIEELSDIVMRKIKEELQQFFQTGSCRLQNGLRMVCVNPSLLEPTIFSWQIHPTLSPFGGFLPLTKDELEKSANQQIMIRSIQKILKNLVSAYRQRIASVQIHVHLGDAVEFCYSEKTPKFDVIDCSNLADHVGLINVLTACSARLSDNPQAHFYTETMNWPRLSFFVTEYVEKALCSPLSMIPTIYGLRLVNHVELGAPTLMNLRRTVAPPVLLCWKRAPSFRNIAVSSSPILIRYLEQLADACFDERYFLALDLLLRGCSTPGYDRCGMYCYTPLTFHYVLSSMIERLGDDGWMKKAVDKLDIHPRFNLTRRTAEAWRNGEKILKMSAETTVPSVGPKDPSARKGTPALRLVFQHRSDFAEKDFFCGTNAQFIDNFKLDIRKTSFGFDRISVSCILAHGHGIGESHIAFVGNTERGQPTFVFEKFKIEECHLSHPFDGSDSLLAPTPSSGEMRMVVDSCVEAKEQFAITIMLKPPGKVMSGKHIDICCL